MKSHFFSEARSLFALIGGFLGAGKTTAIGQLVARWQSRGLRCGIITNDQGRELVDTVLALWQRSQGRYLSLDFLSVPRLFNL